MRIRTSNSACVRTPRTLRTYVERVHTSRESNTRVELRTHAAEVRIFWCRLDLKRRSIFQGFSTVWRPSQQVTMAANAPAQTAAFKQALARCGIAAPARNAIVEQGVENMEACLQFSVDDVAKLCKIIRTDEGLTFMHEQRFTALRYWVEDQKRRGQPTDAALFTLQICKEV